MDGGHGHNDNTLHLDDNTTVACTFHFQEDTLLPFEFTARDTYLGAFLQIHLLGLEVEKMVAVTAGNGNEAFHLLVGNNDFAAGATVVDVLQIGDQRLDTLHL